MYFTCCQPKDCHDLRDSEPSGAFRFAHRGTRPHCWRGRVPQELWSGHTPSSQAARRSGHGASVSRHAPRPHHYAFFSYSKGDAGHKIPDLYEGVTAKPHLAGRIVGRLRAELTIARQLFRNRQPGTRSTRFPAQPWPAHATSDRRSN